MKGSHVYLDATAREPSPVEPLNGALDAVVRDTFSKIGVPTEKQAKALHRDAQLNGELERETFRRINLRFLAGRSRDQGNGAEEIREEEKRRPVV